MKIGKLLGHSYLYNIFGKHCNYYSFKAGTLQDDLSMFDSCKIKVYRNHSDGLYDLLHVISDEPLLFAIE